MYTNPRAPSTPWLNVLPRELRQRATRHRREYAKRALIGEAEAAAQTMHTRYANGTAYYEAIPEVKYLPVSVIYRAFMDVMPEVTRVSSKVTEFMDFSEPVDARAFRDPATGWESVYPPQMYYGDRDESASRATPDAQLVDGHHRLAAAIQTGREWLPVSLHAVNARGEKINALIYLSRMIESKLNTNR